MSFQTTGQRNVFSLLEKIDTFISRVDTDDRSGCRCHNAWATSVMRLMSDRRSSGRLSVSFQRYRT